MDRRIGSLFGVFAGDALAMPVHWYYDVTQLRKDYGAISTYVAPKDTFKNSIMNLSNTGGGGRGSDQGDIVGSVILHGKKKYWIRGGNYHYHLGLQAGENTLEAQLARLVLRCIAEFPSNLDTEDSVVPFQTYFLDKYVSFMTTPGSHNDTYAATGHRMFFANFVRGKPPSECADNDGHNTDAIDALTLVIPMTVACADAPAAIRHALVLSVMHAIRRTGPRTDKCAIVYSDMLCRVLNEEGTLEDEVETAGREIYGPTFSVREQVASSRGRPDPMTACYIDTSFAALLFFAMKYSGSHGNCSGVETGLLANANAGGENVARGAALGALLGAAHGYENGFPAWMKDGLLDCQDIQQEIQRVLTPR